MEGPRLQTQAVQVPAGKKKVSHGGGYADSLRLRSAGGGAGGGGRASMGTYASANPRPRPGTMATAGGGGGVAPDIRSGRSATPRLTDPAAAPQPKPGGRGETFWVHRQNSSPGPGSSWQREGLCVPV